MQIFDLATPYKLIQARHGLFLANPGDLYIGRALLKYGEYSELEWQLLEPLMFSGKDAIEVGANIGAHTVPMARKLAHMGQRLLAVEPQPVIFQNMCANIALNALFNVQAENAACSDVSGWLTFQALDPRHENNFGGVRMQIDGSGNQRVRAVKLDDLVAADFNAGLIKIDVEGFEQKVLEGATKTITRCRPFIYLENDRVESSSSLIEYLWAADYALWWHLPRAFNPNNFAQNSINIYGDVVSFNMLAAPKELSLNLSLPAVESADQHPLKP